MLTDYASDRAARSRGWWAAPGLGNDDPNEGERRRWRAGRRHRGGRVWLFADAHVKWHPDPPFEIRFGVPTSEASIRAYYDARQVHTYPR